MRKREVEEILIIDVDDEVLLEPRSESAPIIEVKLETSSEADIPSECAEPPTEPAEPPIEPAEPPSEPAEPPTEPAEPPSESAEPSETPSCGSSLSLETPTLSVKTFSSLKEINNSEAGISSPEPESAEHSSSVEVETALYLCDVHDNNKLKQNDNRR